MQKQIGLILAESEELFMILSDQSGSQVSFACISITRKAEKI